MTARCPFCEAVRSISGLPEPVGREISCGCGAVGVLCAPKTEPETSVRFAEMGLSDTPFSNRRLYMQEVSKAIESSRGGRRIVFLDPDTGLAPRVPGLE